MISNSLSQSIITCLVESRQPHYYAIRKFWHIFYLFNTFFYFWHFFLHLIYLFHGYFSAFNIFFFLLIVFFFSSFNILNRKKNSKSEIYKVKENIFILPNRRRKLSLTPVQMVVNQINCLTCKTIYVCETSHPWI